MLGYVFDSHSRLMSNRVPLFKERYTDEIANNIGYMEQKFNNNDYFITHIAPPNFNLENETAIFDKEKKEWSIVSKGDSLTTDEIKKQKMDILYKNYYNLQTAYLQNGYFIALPFLQEVENNKVKMTTIASLMNLTQQAQTNGTVEFTQIQGFNSLQDFMLYIGGDKSKIINLYAKGIPFIFCDWFISVLNNIYQHNVTKYNQFIARINADNQNYNDLLVDGKINSKHITYYDINLIFQVKENARQLFIKEADSKEQFISFNPQQPIMLDQIIEWLNTEVNKEGSELINEYSADYNDQNRINQFNLKYNDLVLQKNSDNLVSYPLFKDLSI